MTPPARTRAAVSPRSEPLRAGERVQLTDAKGRRHSIDLVAGGSFHTHRGVLAHDEVIGKSDGSVVATTSGVEYLAFRPLLGDFVMSMPRGAAIVYPKDAAQIVALGDVFPGATVVEAGVGSGALALYLLRAIGESGSLLSIERRADFAEVARANVDRFFGAAHPAWRVEIGEFDEVAARECAEGGVDRVILDMLAPWENVDAAARVLAPGGVLVAYVATTTQLSRFAETVRGHGAYAEPEASESLVRTWHLEGLAVRPDHRMVGHTGFLCAARRLAPGVVPPVRKRRPTSTGADADAVSWTEEAFGERDVSAKRVRRAARRAAGTGGVER